MNEQAESTGREELAKLYPECEKLAKVAPDSQIIGEFIDWLGEQGMVIARWEDAIRAIPKTTEQLLASYFEIDLDLVEQEREKILANLQG